MSTIGLLQCDHVLPPFQHIAGDYPEMFRRWLPDVRLRVYDLPAGETPGSLDECEGWVSTGSRHSVYEDDVPWIGVFAEIVQRMHAERRRFVGVCFGHQMMGHALGGRVVKCGRGWGVGVHDFAVKWRDPWMRPELDGFSLLMSCQDQVEALPPGAVVLASSEHCPVGMFRCGTLLGIQGHPEFTPEYARALLEHRREWIGAERADAALESLSRPCNSRELAEWSLLWLTQA